MRLAEKVACVQSVKELLLDLSKGLGKSGLFHIVLPTRELIPLILGVNLKFYIGWIIG